MIESFAREPSFNKISFARPLSSQIRKYEVSTSNFVDELLVIDELMDNSACFDHPLNFPSANQLRSKQEG